MDIVDVVNKNNQVLYQVTKDEAHRKGLLHRTVIAQIINSKGHWILTKQAPDRQDPGQYVSPVGGHVLAGESEIDALKREVFEEAGIKDFDYKFMGRGIFNRFVCRRHENHYFITFEVYSDQRLVISNESVSFKKFTKNKLKALLQKQPKMFGDAFHFHVRTIYPELLILQ